MQIEQEETTQLYRSLPASVLVFLFLLFLVAGVYYYGPYKQAQEKARNDVYTQEFQKGVQAVRQLQPEWEDTLIKAVEYAPTLRDKERAEFNLALGYHLHNNNAKAVEIYKRIAANEAYGASAYRGGSVVAILSIYEDTYDQEFAESVIFKGDPWASFLQEGDIDKAIRLAYEWSESLGPVDPTATAQYQIARWYGEQLLTHKLSKGGTLSEATENEYRDKFRFYLHNGDRILPMVLIGTKVEEWRKATLIGLKGKIYALAYFIDAKDDDKKIAEDSFKQSFVYLSSALENYAERYKGFLLPLHFDYATFLAYVTIYDKMNRQKDVENELISLIQEKNRELNTFKQIRNIGTFGEQEKGFMKKRILGMAKLSPGFKDLLKDLGWEL